MSEKNSIQDISDKPREYVLETTQEEYDEMKARGIDEEAIPSVGKTYFPPPFAQNRAARSKN